MTKYQVKLEKTTKFKDLNVGDEFIFIYEIKWNERLRQPSKKLPYVTMYVKTGDNTYRLSPFGNKPLIDNRKFRKMIPECSGYTYEGTFVIQTLSAELVATYENQNNESILVP